MVMIDRPDVIPSLKLAEAASLIRRADRLLVVGCSGGGKSTLSQKIAARFGLEYISIDRDILWLPGWVQRERGEQRRIIERLIAGERWIMDGTNPSTFDIRMPRSNLVIWVRMPRFVNVWGILSRWAKHAGRTRPEMAAGCPERMDWEFFWFVWTWERAFSQRVTNGLLEYGRDTPVLVLKSRRQMRELLDLLSARA
jgi:adenylate kinase family enzyme